MKKIFNKFTKFLLLVCLIISDLMTPIKVFAAEDGEAVTPQKGDVGINGEVVDGDSVSVTASSGTDQTADGNVTITKTLTKTDEEGVYIISFNLRGNEVHTTTETTIDSYTVFVLDASRSMDCSAPVNSSACGYGVSSANNNTPWDKAKDAAINFSSSFVERGDSNHLALVTFNGTGYQKRAFMNGANGVFVDSDFGSTAQGTDYNEGLSKAYSYLNALSSDIKESASLNIIFISDGAPTSSNYSSTLNNLKTMGVNIYTFAYNLSATSDRDAYNTLRNVSTNNSVTSISSADINEILQTFVDTVTVSSPAGTGATVNDTIGGSFNVTSANTENVTTDNKNVNIDFGEITSDEEGVTISFEITIDGDNTETGWVDTNAGFTLSYTDADGNSTPITYSDDEPQPQVYWVRNTYDYIIRYYKDEVTDPSDTEHYIDSSESFSAYNGEEIVITDDAIKNAHLPNVGYALSDSNTYRVVIDKTKEENVINILYERVDVNYSYEYYFEDLEGVYNKDTNYPGGTATAKYGDEVSYTSHLLENVPTGFELNTSKTEENNNGIYTITQNGIVINIYYSRKNLTYDVEYLFEGLDGSYGKLDSVNDIEDISAKYGEEVSYTDYVLSPAPEGYVLDTVQSVGENEGKYVIVDNDTLISIYYNKVRTNFTVNYYFNGTPFDEVYSYSNDAMYGSTLYAINYKLETVNNEALENKKTTDNEDYFLDPNNDNNSASVTVGTTPVEMDLYYISTMFEEDAEDITKSSKTIEVTKANQEIDYTITYENVINNVREGDVIAVTIVDTLPFEIIEEDSNLVSDGVEGVYDSTNKTITWTFEETASEYIEEYKIEKTISFIVVYKDFADISSSDNNNLINTANGVTTINDKSTDGETSDTEEIPVKIKGTLVVIYRTSDNEVFEKNTTTEYAGTSYSTIEKDFLGYRLVRVVGNREGKYLPNETVTVEYIYDLSEGDITTNKVTKEGPETISDISKAVEYTLKYNGTIKDYIGKATLTVVDTLPTEINDDESNYDNRCSYKNGTITCVVEYDIVEDDYETNEENEKVFNICEEFTLELVFNNIESDTITNSVDSTLELREISKDSDDSVVTEVLMGTLEVTYKTEDGTDLAEKETTTKYAGTSYDTEAKEFFGYKLKSTPDNKSGTYVANSTITVEYVYVLGDGEITDNKVTKEGPEVISDVNDFAEYTIIYNGTIRDYIGKATLTVTDYPSYEIVYTGCDSRCDYDYENNKFICTVEYDITEDDYETNEENEKVFNINEVFYIDIIYGAIDSNTITNKVDSKLELRKVHADSDDSVDSKVLMGSLLVSYIDEEGSVLDSYTTSDYAGSYYETEEREFDGYTFKSSSDNTEGFLVADETTYVEYVYAKNVGTSEEVEELPPQTGIENINLNYIGYVLVALFLLLIGKKKEAKNN